MQEFIPGSDIFTVDALYYQPELAAIHLVKSENRIAIVDTGTQFSLPQIEAALQAIGLDYAAVEYIILTHIHLDHAGGASALMQCCNNATLVVHERGARHMAQPEKLIAGSVAVYGEKEFQQLYGEISPIDAERIISPGDGEELTMGRRRFCFYDTPGHASHHFCIHDLSTNAMFTGDTLGVAYQALRDPEHAFVMPTTTPVQFNPVALHDSIDKVMAQQPAVLYCTHYSAVTPNPKIIAGLHEQIEDFVMLTQQAAEHPDEMIEYLTASLNAYTMRLSLIHI